MTDAYGNLFPQPFILPQKPAKYEQRVLVNWLHLEVDDTAARRMPILQHLTGHRNIEVFYFVRNMWDWTAVSYH